MIEASHEPARRPPTRIYGVDFSGAAAAGRKIWIASGLAWRGALRIETCHRAEDLPGSGPDRATSLTALQDLIRGTKDAAFGLDFPFGLPAGLLQEKSWERFARAFPERYVTPEEFRESCRRSAGGRELRRVTDVQSRTPFSPYNLRLYRQTFFGIRDLLAPLVAQQAACVLPMQRALPGKSWIIEICPASLLKRERLYLPYKGKAARRRTVRARIVEDFENKGVLLTTPEVRRTILADANGDALDSVLAALCTFRALQSPAGLFPSNHPAYAVEGYVYA